MCGIAGLLYSSPGKTVSQCTLTAMGDAIAHRGPDAEGYLNRDGIGLVHRRLSIIDLSGGDQPLSNEDSSVHVVFNGEIYNYRELQRELKSKGHQFKTKSDTEVLVHLYEEEGEQLVSRLRGMFAFAIWDEKKKRLLLARDRIGLKPLYVYQDDEKVVFGSELKAILAHPDIDRTIDPFAIEEFITFGVIFGDRTIFKRIRKLLPAHTMTVSADHLGGRVARYWQFQIEPDHGRSATQWEEEVEAKIQESVEAHQIADVPVGAFLSGGLDSSIMVAIQSGLTGVPVQTFSIGFEESKFSELPYARHVAEMYGTKHVERIVTPEALQTMDDLIHHYDEPFADSSAIPTLAVSRLARESVKVVVSGDGGDEAFGGYSRYAHDLRESALRGKLPVWLRRSALRNMAAVWPKADWLPRFLRAKTTLTNLSLDPADAYANSLCISRPPGRRQLLTDDLRSHVNGHSPERIVSTAYGTAPASDALAGMISADVNTILPDDFLTKVDRASMACGLEVRPPLVDHELLELSARMPSEYKIRGGDKKWILKKIYKDRLPDGMTTRPKQGFEIPVDSWLRKPLREMFESTVLCPNNPTADWINQKTARRLYQSHLSGTGRHGSILWALLVLGRWADRYITSANESTKVTGQT